MGREMGERDGDGQGEQEMGRGRDGDGRGERDGERNRCAKESEIGMNGERVAEIWGEMGWVGERERW